MCWTSYALGLLTPLLLGIIGGCLARLVNMRKIMHMTKVGTIIIDVNDAQETPEAMIQRIYEELRRIP